MLWQNLCPGTLGTNDDNERGKIRNPKDFLKYLRRAGSQGLRVITTGAKYDAAPMEEFLKVVFLLKICKNLTMDSTSLEQTRDCLKVSLRQTTMSPEPS